MSKVIHCKYGLITRRDADELLIAAVTEHVVLAHPDLVGKLSHQDILAMAEEA